MDKLKDIEEYAVLNNIPIMEKEGICYLTDFIKKNKVKTILEIGSAIGYSAINMALCSDDIFVMTIERDKNRYLKAISNIKDFKLEDRIKIVNDDALTIDLKDKYDLIFIDAAKSQNVKFFLKYKNNLNDDGTIITDNINFHGLVYKDDIKSRNLRQLVRKIKNYKVFLEDNKEFKTEFLNIGDGIAISRKSVD